MQNVKKNIVTCLHILKETSKECMGKDKMLYASILLNTYKVLEDIKLDIETTYKDA